MTEHDEPALAPAPSFPTSIGVSTTETITVLGHDLAADLMGKVSFTELAYWLVMQRRPTPGQARVLEAVLVALADHGFTPTAITARLTYLSAPDSVQGALADLGLPAELLRGFALLARTAGLLGHLASERRNPIGMDVFQTVEHNADYSSASSSAIQS